MFAFPEDHQDHIRIVTVDQGRPKTIMREPLNQSPFPWIHFLLQEFLLVLLDHSDEIKDLEEALCAHSFQAAVEAIHLDASFSSNSLQMHNIALDGDTVACIACCTRTINYRMVAALTSTFTQRYLDVSSIFISSSTKTSRRSSI